MQEALLERRRCPSPTNLSFSVQAKVTGMGKISSALIDEFLVLCLEFLRENLGSLLLWWVQGSCQKSALNQDFQLGPGKPNWATVVM